jgi:hypothetical protein
MRPGPICAAVHLPILKERGIYLSGSGNADVIARQRHVLAL